MRFVKKYIFLGFILVLGHTEAQQNPQYSMYMMNPFTINPAVSSTEDYIDAQIGHRTQWTSFEGAPKTTFITAYGTINKPFYQYHYKQEHANWHGVGFQFFDDKAGAIQQNAYLFAYSYNMGITRKTRLSIGSYLGFKQLRTDRSLWENIDDGSDFVFLSSLSSKIKPELQLGAVLYNDDFFVTFSATNLVGQQISFRESTDNRTNAILQKHYFLSGGVKLPASEKMTFTPSTMIRYTANTPVSTDLNLKVDHEQLFWYGASVRVLESANVFAGLNFKKIIDLTYAYEYTFSSIGNFNNGTHEVIVGLRLQHPKNIIDPSKFW